MRRRYWIAALTIIGLPVAGAAFLQQSQEPKDAARLFAQILQRVEESAVDSLSRSAIYERAARGLIKNLNDPYADLYSPECYVCYYKSALPGKGRALIQPLFSCSF